MKRENMGDLSKLVTKERVSCIEYLHHLLNHKYDYNQQQYDEILDLLISDAKEFLTEVQKELSN